MRKYGNFILQFAAFALVLAWCGATAARPTPALAFVETSQLITAPALAAAVPPPALVEVKPDPAGPSQAEKILADIARGAQLTSAATAPAAPINPIFVVISAVAAAVGSFAAALGEIFRSRRLKREKENS